MACLGGQGVEYYYNGLRRFPSWRSSTGNINNSNASKSYVMVEGDDEQSVNGEKVEMEMSRERRVQGVRALVSGIGFTMGMVGIWGDGA
jgi:autophagy-related protein 33